MLSWTWTLAWQATFGHVAYFAWPHVALYLSAASSAGLGLLWARSVRSSARTGQRRETDGPPPATERTVSILGVLSLVLILASLGWDYSWHSASEPTGYFLSPPHGALALGIPSVLAMWGCTLRASIQSAGHEEMRGLPAFPSALLGGLIVLWLATVGTEYVGRPNYWRGSDFYLTSAAIVPAALVTISRASRGVLGATLSSLVYLLLVLVAYGVLMLIPVTEPAGSSGSTAARFVLPHFPLLLVVPALGVDGLVSVGRSSRGPVRRLIRAGLLGFSFTVLLLAVHWPASTLIVPGMDAGFLARFWPSDAAVMRHATQFWNLDANSLSMAKGLLSAMGVATLSSILGLVVGDRLRNRAC